MRASRLSPSTSSKPAVSIISRSMSPIRPVPKRRSRVTPGRSSTSASLRPARRLNRVDLPTFGRPTMAILTMRQPLARPLANGDQVRLLADDIDRAAGGDRAQQHVVADLDPTLHLAGL